MLLRRTFFWLPIIILVGTVIYFIITTSPFVRYWADDLCSGIFLRNSGFLGAQIGWWQSWTGRFSYIAFLDLFESFGPLSARILPLLLFAGLILTLVPAFFFETILAPFFVVIALINAPNLIQSFYWQVGSLNYAAEFIFLNLFISSLVWPKKYLAYPAAILLPFVAAGFSESFALSQITLFLFMILICWVGDFSDKKLRLKLLIIGLVAGIASIIFMSLAPGNAARYSVVDHPPSVAFVIKSTFLGTKWYLQRMLMIKPFVYSLILSVCVIFLTVERNIKFFEKWRISSRKLILLMLLFAASAVSTTAAVTFSAYWAMAYTPPERAMFIVIYMIFLAFWGFCFAGSILLTRYLKGGRRRLSVGLLLVLEIVFTVLLIRPVATNWKDIRTEITAFAKDWDVAEKTLVEASKEKSVAVIKNIKPVGQLDGYVENNGWVLNCTKEYYEVDKVKLSY